MKFLLSLLHYLKIQVKKDGNFDLKLQVDIAYAPFVERYQLFLLDVKKYDITEGRPKLKAWIEVQAKFHYSVSFLLCSLLSVFLAST